MPQDQDRDRPFGAGKAIDDTWEKLHPQDPDEVETDPDDSEDGETMDDPHEEQGRDDLGYGDEDEPSSPFGEPRQAPLSRDTY